MAVVPEAKDRVLRLIDFLAAYDARKNPPVRDIAAYRLYLLRDADVPAEVACVWTAPGPYRDTDYLASPLWRWSRADGWEDLGTVSL